MNAAADELCKTRDLVNSTWFQKAENLGLIDAESSRALRERQIQLLPIRKEDIRLPDDWLLDDPGLAERLAQEFHECMAGGFVSSVHRAIIHSIEHLAYTIRAFEQGGTFVNNKSLAESELQAEVLKILRGRTANAIEGAECGGGETDIILDDIVVVENKVRNETVDPFSVGADYSWQARRYAISICQRIVISMVAYKPASEAAILPQSARIRVLPLPGAPDENFAQIRLVVPWGHGIPSRAKQPPPKTSRKSKRR